MSFSKGEAEFRITIPITEYHDRDFSRDRRSVSSSVNLLNGVTIYWTCKKQTQVSEQTNGSEVSALFSGVRKTTFIRNFFTYIGHPFKEPTKTFEDKQSTICKVIQYRLTVKANPIDVLISALHQQHNIGTFSLSHFKS